MKIKAEIIADSKNELGNRITTMIVTFPRYILAELNTHRMFSKNSASSRAIPFKRLLNSVGENPFIPIAWQKDHTGMQGTEYFEDKETTTSLTAGHLLARDYAIERAVSQSKIGLTKQIVNRYLEPFMWHTVLITATEWENFFHLRCPKYDMYGITEGATGYKFRSKKDAVKALGGIPKQTGGVGEEQEIVEWLKLNKGQADIHMMALAEAMWDAYNESAPKQLKSGEWHIPFGDNINRNKILETLSKNELFISSNYVDNALIKIATARCARVSYTVVGDENKAPDYEADIKLHDRLSTSGHWSCFEHCAKAMDDWEYKSLDTGDVVDKKLQGWSGNFHGWKQYRKTFVNENITKTSL